VHESRPKNGSGKRNLEEENDDFPEVYSGIVSSSQSALGSQSQTSTVPQLEHAIGSDPNLSKHKEELCASGITVEEIQNLCLEDLSAFLQEFLKFSAFTAKKCAQCLKKVAQVYKSNKN